jgi:hypothetical protein
MMGKNGERRLTRTYVNTSQPRVVELSLATNTSTTRHIHPPNFVSLVSHPSSINT